MTPCRILFVLACCLLALGCRRDALHPTHSFEQTVPAAGDLTSVWFTSPDTGFATGGRPWNGGFIARTVDGGRTWTVDTLVNNRLECVRFDATGQGYACGLDGLVLHRPPGESRWIVFRQDWTWYRACSFRDSRRGVAVAGEGFGAGWARRFGPDRFWETDTVSRFSRAMSDVWATDTTTVVACGLGWLGRSTDGGGSWQRLPATGEFFEALHFPTADTGYCCGSSGTILKTTDGGRTWQTLRDGGRLLAANRALRAIWFVDAEHGYLAGDEGLLWRTTNGGHDWTPLAGTPDDVDFNGVFAFADRGWAVGSGGRVFYFER